MTRVLIGVPCFNCETQVSRVAEGLKPFALKNNIDIFFIDNCSTDDTFLQLTALSSQIRCKVIQNPRNLGLGGTQKVLVQSAIDQSYDALVVLHGDDQADCSDIWNLLSHFETKPAHYLGSRFMYGSRRLGYQKTRVIGNLSLNIFFCLVTLKKISDLGSGLNLFSVKHLKEINHHALSGQFNFNVELLLRFIDSRQEFHFIPITWRETDQVSNARNFKVAFSMLGSLFNWLFKKEKRA